MTSLFVAAMMACVQGQCMVFIDTTTVHKTLEACNNYNAAQVVELHKTSPDIALSAGCVEFVPPKPKGTAI